MSKVIFLFSTAAVNKAGSVITCWSENYEEHEIVYEWRPMTEIHAHPVVKVSRILPDLRPGAQKFSYPEIIHREISAESLRGPQIDRDPSPASSYFIYFNEGSFAKKRGVGTPGGNS